jgi:hypothetical protein
MPRDDAKKLRGTVQPVKVEPARLPSAGSRRPKPAADPAQRDRLERPRGRSASIVNRSGDAGVCDDALSDAQVYFDLDGTIVPVNLTLHLGVRFKSDEPMPKCRRVQPAADSFN